MQMEFRKFKAGAVALLLVVVAGAAIWVWRPFQPRDANAGFASGNGRIEATDISVATKLAGRVDDIFVAEGDFVKAGQKLARMQIERTPRAIRRHVVGTFGDDHRHAHFVGDECGQHLSVRVQLVRDPHERELLQCVDGIDGTTRRREVQGLVVAQTVVLRQVRLE